MRKIRKINVAYIVLQKTMDLGYARVPAVENDALGGHFTLHLAFTSLGFRSHLVQQRHGGPGVLEYLKVDRDGIIPGDLSSGGCQHLDGE